jgi:peptidoglycan/xylan/chitin deacetylase (PgdA/CDA1 family)
MGNYDGFNNVALQRSPLFFPYVDFQLLKSGNVQLPIWPNEKKFSILLTHDVDSVGLYSVAEAWRKWTTSPRGRINKKARFAAFRELVRAIALRLTGARDPYQNFEGWMALEERFGVRSTWFFSTELPGKVRPVQDCQYAMSDKIRFRGSKVAVRELIRTLDQGGWEVGLHPSITSRSDVGILRTQKGILEEAVGRDVTSVRQHFLMFDPDKTPEAQAEAGFLYDSTYGFNKIAGFRAGTSYPFRFPGKSPLQIPLIIQDGAMFRENGGMGMGKDAALSLILEMMDRVEKVGGVLNVLWHPMYYSQKYKDWIWVYERLIEAGKERGAWFATQREIGEHWCRYNSESVSRAMEKIDLLAATKNFELSTGEQ